MDPDPARTPDLESGGGVAPGATPPETAQTSGLSAPEPSTRHHFPASGITVIIAVAAVVIVFLVVAVALIVSLA
ncbi:DUF6480 family protein [Nocardia veterana]